jgi:hypothetical protein
MKLISVVLITLSVITLTIFVSLSSTLENSGNRFLKKANVKPKKAPVPAKKKNSVKKPTAKPIKTANKKNSVKKPTAKPIKAANKKTNVKKPTKKPKIVKIMKKTSKRPMSKRNGPTAGSSDY